MGILGVRKRGGRLHQPPLRRSVLDVELVDGVELELDLLPGLEGDGQLGAVLRGFREDVAALFLEMTAGVACLDAGLEGHTVGSSTCSGAPGVTVGTTTELKNGVVAEDGDQGGHMPTRGYRRKQRRTRQAWNPSPDRRSWPRLRSSGTKDSRSWSM